MVRIIVTKEVSSMEDRFLRNLGALTEAECALLGKKSVLLAGCGGLGGYLLEYLLRLGVGRVLAADGERFEPTNLNRQLLCTEASLGRFKAEAAAERAAALGLPGRVIPIPERLDGENLPGLLRGCDPWPASSWASCRPTVSGMSRPNG